MNAEKFIVLIKEFLPQLFLRLKEENPQAFEKIIPIVGDISEPQLGLKAEDEELLSEKVCRYFSALYTIFIRSPKITVKL